jgi:hypothetical protein
VTVNVSSGKVRQYRVRTRGAAGSAYFSPYAVCQTLATCPTLEAVPVVEAPRNGASSYCSQPLMRVSCRAAGDGTARKLMRSVDGGAWTLRKEFTKNLSLADQLPALAYGTHTIRYRMEGADGAVGDAVSVQIMICERVWSRDLSRGMVISSRTVSHRAEIEELLSAVNALRAFYGLDAVTLPGTVGRLCDWKPQMKAMQSGINEVRQAMDQQKHQWTTAPGWPTADILLDLRRQSMLL